MEVSGQFHAPAALLPGKSLRHLLDRMGVPQSRPGRYGEEKIVSLPGIEPGPSSP
jgi:hypothetical protein